MSTKTGIFVTGACGLLGSAVTISLRMRHPDALIVAVDQRAPTPLLLAHTPDCLWRKGDICDQHLIDQCFLALASCDQIFVYHFAAYYDFETEWIDAYQQSNLDALRYLCQASVKHQVTRFIFTSSLAVFDAKDLSQPINERSQARSTLPYGQSKLRGEQIVASFQALPSCIFRVGAVFTEMTDLPPLYGLLSLWSASWPMNTFIVGNGSTAMPYIHREDFCALMLAVIDQHAHIKKHEMFFACDDHSISHLQLFQHLGNNRRHCSIPKWFAALGLRIQLVLGKCTKRLPIERLWMFRYVDSVFQIDTSYTQHQLKWKCTKDIQSYLPRMFEHAVKDPKGWHAHNHRRNNRIYEWTPDPCSAS